MSPIKAKGSKWGIDQSHAKAVFVCGHEGIAPVTGWFDKILGGVDYDGKDLKKARVKAYIEANSINTGVQARDFHLKSENFFDVQKFPLIKFESNAIKPLSPGKFKMEGSLEIKGIKKPVTLDCSGPVGPVEEDEKRIKRLGFTAKTSINRKDFGIKWNREVSKGIFMIGDQVDLTLEIELLKDIKAPD